MSQTLSNIIDNITKMFSETRREQPYFRIRKSPGDFYYYTFIGEQIIFDIKGDKDA